MGFFSVGPVCVCVHMCVCVCVCVLLGGALAFLCGALDAPVRDIVS